MPGDKPEVLAPSGNMKALKAAIAAGADACYLAGNSFGARAFAGNFTDAELLEALEYAHLFGVRLYLTVNTLIKDNEFSRLYDFLCPLYEAGLDSVLVQDFGVLKFIKENFPLLPIHSSTQMNILTPEGASFVKNLGVKRIVAAREMTLKELKAIKDTSDIELEAFVHGAMCVCYSGRCLFSSMLGGRSGNRGCCAQPCRKLYNGSYRLSMRDMCTLGYVPDLIEAGVDSFKIEGRMKNEYYVASAVDSYKRMIEDYTSGCFTVEKAFAEEKRLLDVFSIECLVHLEQYIILTILLSWLMILFKLMRKRNMNTDVCQNFTHSVFHDVNHFFAKSDNSFKYWKNIFSSFFVLFILGWCKSNCSFALLNFAI